MTTHHRIELYALWIRLERRLSFRQFLEMLRRPA